MLVGKAALVLEGTYHGVDHDIIREGKTRKK